MTPHSFPFHRTHGQRRGGLTCWLPILLLGTAAVGLTAWGAANHLFADKGKAEKNLLTPRTFSNLKAGGEARPSPSAQPEHDLWEEPWLAQPLAQAPPAPLMPPVPAVPAPVEIAVPQFVPPPAVKVELPVVPVPPLVVEPPPQAVAPPPQPSLEPLAFVPLSPLGDSPMMHTWKLVGLTAMMATSLATAPLPLAAQAPENSDTKAILKRLDELEKSLSESFKNVIADITALRKDSLTHKVDLGKANLKIGDMEGELAKLRKDLEAVKARLNAEPTPAPSIDKLTLDDIKSKLGQIEQALSKMQPDRISLSPPSVGRVHLVNLYPERLMFIINAKTHFVEPGSALTVDAIPAGSLAYQVISPTWGVRANKSTTLAPNETFTLTVR